MMLRATLMSVLASGAVLGQDGKAPEPITIESTRPPARFRVDDTYATQNKRIEDALDRVLPEVSFDQVPLPEVINSLRGLLGVNMQVDWNVMEAFGVRRDVSITLKVNDLPAGRVLELALREAGGGQVRMCLEAQKGVLIVSTCEEAGRHMVTRVYDLRDLLRAIVAPPQTADAGTGARGMPLHKATDTEFRARWARDKPAQEAADPNVGEVFHELQELITSVVNPDSWEINAGRGSMRAVAGLLVVRNNQWTHRELYLLLEDLREKLLPERSRRSDPAP